MKPWSDLLLARAEKRKYPPEAMLARTERRKTGEERMLELGMETVSCLVFFMSLEFFKSLDHLLSWALKTRCYGALIILSMHPKVDFISVKSMWSLLVLVPENSIFCFYDISDILKFRSFVFNFLHNTG